MIGRRGLNATDFRDSVIAPTLYAIGGTTISRAVENLLLGTALQESGLHYLRQIGDERETLGRGVYQMEKRTHDDIHENYLEFRDDLKAKVFRVAGSTSLASLYNQLAGNLYYATAMARVHYRRVPEPLPEYDDIGGLARYWKKYYNTHLGKGTVWQFIRSWKRAKVSF